MEFEQGGSDRAKYGENLLARLARDLKRRNVSGLSTDVLERTRTFYRFYPQIGEKISATASRKMALRSPKARGMIPSLLTLRVPAKPF